MLKAQFPQWADLPIGPVDHDGWDNTTFRLGDDMSVRLPSHAAYEPQIMKEHEWLPQLAPQRSAPDHGRGPRDDVGREAVWVHGDVVPDNLIVHEGRLSAVIDFGCSAVGDPACDLVMAWAFFSGPSREAFRAALRLDEATWARGRGWVLWKALTVLARVIDSGSDDEWTYRRLMDEVIADGVTPSS